MKLESYSQTLDTEGKMTTDTKIYNFSIYFDFRWPFVYNVAVWLTQVRKNLDGDINIDWKPFSLAQANNPDDFKFWEHPDVLAGKDNTLLAHQAGLAIKRQGPDTFEKFLIILLKKRHEERLDLTDYSVIESAAIESSADMEQFKNDLSDVNLLKEIGENHTYASEELGAFGVPTFHFETGQSKFLTMFVPPENESASMFTSLMEVMGNFNYVGEMKRPQPPWPLGVA